MSLQSTIQLHTVTQNEPERETEQNNNRINTTQKTDQPII